MTAIVDIGGAARYRPEVRSAYYERVYVHSPERQDTHKRAMQALQSLQRQD